MQLDPAMADAGPQIRQGAAKLSPEMAAAGATTRWQLYFEVADCDAAAAAVTANGGTVVVPASDIPGVGRFAVALDPDGAQFAVIASVPSMTAN